MSAIESPVFFSRRRIAGTGPTPMIEGSTPAVTNVRNAPSDFRPSASALSLVISSAAAAPSDSGELLPGVTEPLTANEGFSCASASAVVSPRTSSSRRNSKGWRAPSG